VEEWEGGRDSDSWVMEGLLMHDFSETSVCAKALGRLLEDLRKKVTMADTCSGGSFSLVSTFIIGNHCSQGIFIQRYWLEVIGMARVAVLYS
jgi:hypothetical protein